MGNIIGAIIVGVVAAASFAVSFFHFKEKGFLLNNAYIYASKTERETVNKKPYYRQSGVAFALIGIIFLINALDIILETGWLFYVVIGVTVIAVIYAIASTVVIERKYK